MSGHVRGAPPGGRSSASGYGSREGERGVMGERGGGGQVSNSFFMLIHEAGKLGNTTSCWKNEWTTQHHINHIKHSLKLLVSL